MDRRTEYVERLSAHMVEWDSQINMTDPQIAAKVRQYFAP